MDRLTRHDLKTDKFVEEVGQTVHFLEEHRSQAVRYGGIALAVLAVAIGGYYWQQSRKAERQSALYEAVNTYNSRVSPSTQEGMKTFPTQGAKNEAVQKELNALASTYSGSEEAAVATYLLGLNAADSGNIDAAKTYLKKAAEDAGKDYASLAKLALADLYGKEGNVAECEKLLRDLVSNPTTLVTKEQASVTLARLIASRKPNEARALLEPLRTSTGAVSRVAIQAMSELGLVGGAPPPVK